MTLPDSTSCTGCSACANACPHDAIGMRSDDEGFVAPVIDFGRCVSCGLCERACPLNGKERLFPPQIEKHPLCGCSKDENVWRDSTSGGAFTEICFALRDFDPIVFGARFDGVDRVVHDYVQGVDKIGAFRKSKYVQSEIGDSFRKCREFLQAGKYVVFSGTPCQIAGLRMFLGKDFENLLTIEFICHGVGSPRIFKECLNLMGRGNRKIVEYQFRSKQIWPPKDLYVSTQSCANGTRISVVWDLYCRLFLRSLCVRQSCFGHCVFRKENRVADLTLGDARKEGPRLHLNDSKNWSVLVANTKKGKAVADTLTTRMILHNYPLELLKETNPLYFHDVNLGERRAEFFGRYRQGESLIKIANSMAPDPFAFSLVLFLKRVVRYAFLKIGIGRIKERIT